MFKIFFLLFSALLAMAMAAPSPVASPDPAPAPGPSPQVFYGAYPAYAYAYPAVYYG